MLDGKSFTGSIITAYLAFIGRVTLNELALLFAVLSGALTAGYTAYKWIRDIKNDLKNKKP
jgi:4-hydroxybenzoate polyprenyltransferase